MDLTIGALRSLIEPFLSERAELCFRYGAGLTQDLPLEALAAQFPELSRPESFSQVREALANAPPDGDEKPRLQMLLELLAAQREDAAAAAATQAIASFEARATVSLGDETIAFRDAQARLISERSRQRRGHVERALGELLWDQHALYARRIEATLRAAEAIGRGSYVALRDEVSGFQHAPLAAEGEKVLATTEDPYRDLLGYVIKKLDPTLRAQVVGTARRHDLLHATVAPHLSEHFLREDLQPVTSHWLSDMGFHPTAEGRIRLDLDDRPGKRVGAFVAPVRVPEELRLVLRPLGGMGDFAALFNAYGQALYWAHAPRSGAVEDRRLGDSSVVSAHGLLLEHLLLDEAWHRRYLRLTQTLSRDAARLAAFNALALLRWNCAQLAYELSLHERGLSVELSDEYEERHRKALFAGVHRGFFLQDVGPQLAPARALRAYALEVQLHGLMQQRFNEDYWRNPTAGRFLQGLLSRSRQGGASALAEQLTGKPLSLLEAADRLVRIMGA